MSDFNSPSGFTAPDPSYLADLFPGYQIIRLIACGGMGAVYEAVQRSLDRAVAIKILPREFTADDSFRTGFEAEAKTMARLNHPNLIGVYDFGEVDGMLFIIMEYVPGHSLFHAADGQPIIQEEVIPLVCAIARGLAHAHENGIIHRDIKPANILLNNHNEPKIGDFGLARPLESQIQEGEDIFGTPGYTAPEVIQDPQSIDHRADIFSLGVLLHEMLTGMLPDADPRPTSAISQCDPRFDTVIRKATQPSPAARYTSALEIASDLEKIATTAGPRVLQTASPVTRRPASVTTRSHAPIKRPSSKVPLILFLLVAIGITGFLLHQKSQNQTPREEPPVIVDQADSTAPVAPEIETPEPETATTAPEAAPRIDGVEQWRGASSTWEENAGLIRFSVISGDIGNDSDSGVFKHEPWNGDGLFTIEIDSLEAGTSDSKAGLMIREGLEKDARNLFLAHNQNGEVLLQFRSRQGRETMEYRRVPASLRFLRIQRGGDRLTAVASNDGTSWTEIGTLLINDLADQLHVGFAAALAADPQNGPFHGLFHSIDCTKTDTSLEVSDGPAPRTNMNELFRRARSVMRERAKPIIAESEQAYHANLESYVQQSKAMIDTLTASDRDRLAGHYQNVLLAVEANGYIAYTAPRSLRAVDGYREFHQKHLERQHQIESEHTKKMTGLAGIYVNGINLQIERSRAENDLGAVQVLRAEKMRVETIPYYFRSLMERNW